MNLRNPSYRLDDGMITCFHNFAVKRTKATCSIPSERLHVLSALMLLRFPKISGLNLPKIRSGDKSLDDANNEMGRIQGCSEKVGRT